MNEKQTQLVTCLLDLAKRADELGESDMARSMLIMATATMTGETKAFKSWCLAYAQAAFEVALKQFAESLKKVGEPLDKNNNPDKQSP
jgi:hypothetical protein